MSGAGLTGETLFAFIATSAVIEVTPGPNLAYLALIAATEGRKPGYAAVAGVALGLAIVGLAAAFGLAAAINTSPTAFQVLRWGGVLYLLWLAWDGWSGAGEAVSHAAAGSSVQRFFLRGLVTNLLNPKAAVFYIAVLPGFTDPTGPVLGETVTLSIVYVMVATAIHAGIVTAAGTARTWLADKTREARLRKLLSLALAAIAIWFAWKTRI